MGMRERIRRRPDSGEGISAHPGSVRRAIWLQQFCVWFRPLVELESGRLAGVEARIGWDAPCGEPETASLSSADGVAGLPVSLYVDTLRTAFELAESLGGDDEARIILDVTQSDVARFELAEVLRDALAQAGVRASSVELRLAFTDADGEAIAVVDRLHAIGVTVSASLDLSEGGSERLRALPLDRVVLDFGTHPEASAADVEAAAHEAYRRGLEVGGSGVESAAQLATLRWINVALASGVALGREVGRDELRAEQLRARSQRSVQEARHAAWAIRRESPKPDATESVEAAIEQRGLTLVA